MLQRLVLLKPTLEVVMEHPCVQNYLAGLHNQQGGAQALSLGDNIKGTIQDLGFWQHYENYVHIVEDVLKALRVFDGRELATGKAWLTMHSLRGHMKSLREVPFHLPPNVADPLEKTFEKRWDIVFFDLHYDGTLLNPYIKDYLHLKVDGIATHALYHVIRKLEGVIGVHFDDVLEVLTQYEEGVGPYSLVESPNIREIAMLLHQWWHRIEKRALSKIVVHILSLTCSTSSCKRNWSMYSFVHNKSRIDLLWTRQNHWYTFIPIATFFVKNLEWIQFVGTTRTYIWRILI